MERVLVVNDETAEMVEHGTPEASTEHDRKVGALLSEELDLVRALGTRRGISPGEGKG